MEASSSNRSTALGCAAVPSPSLPLRPVWLRWPPSLPALSGRLPCAVVVVVVVVVVDPLADVLMVVLMMVRPGPAPTPTPLMVLALPAPTAACAPVSLWGPSLARIGEGCGGLLEDSLSETRLRSESSVSMPNMLSSSSTAKVDASRWDCAVSRLGPR